MARTFQIIKHPVGKAGHRRGPQLRRVNERLTAKRDAFTRNDHWDWSTERALLDFRGKLFGRTPFAMIEDVHPNEPNRTSIQPNDMVLFELAYGANVLIRLCPPNTGQDAISSVHEW